MADDDPKEPTAPVCSAYIDAGGVELRLEGPGVTGVDAYALWQKIHDTIGNTRHRVGSGSGFVAERQEPPERSPYLGEGGPKAGYHSSGDPIDVRSPEGQLAARRMGFAIKSPLEFQEAPAFGSPEAKHVECFHPWPGCNCPRS